MGYAFDEEFNYDPYIGTAALTRKWHDGTIDKFEGEDALANYTGREGALYRKLNPGGAFMRRRVHNDPKNGIAHKAGDYLKLMSRSPERNAFSRAVGDNPLQGAAVLGGTGLLAGLAGNWVAKKLGLADNPKFHLYGGLGMAALGGLTGYLRSQAAENSMYKMASMQKSSAMYKDPRNFVLEKIQSATDLTMSQKVQLAAQVRRLDRPKAEKLSGLVRSALGFGVGAIIAKFFGLNGKGTVLGGLAGVIGNGIMTALRKPGGFGI